MNEPLPPTPVAPLSLKSSPWSAEIALQIQFYDLDPMEIVWHGRYVEYLENARCALFDQIGYNYPAMKQSGYAWPIIDLHLRYAHPATFGQRIKCALPSSNGKPPQDRLSDQRLHQRSAPDPRQHHASRRRCRHP